MRSFTAPDGSYDRVTSQGVGWMLLLKNLNVCPPTPPPKMSLWHCLSIKGANIYTARPEPRKRQMVSAMPFVSFQPQ